uniref:Uncharacterized protein n=1 Tax=Myotis myotis TaxID=51298 RepID=A0A7J7SS23_MYOMY|nr:hypothetical protein mMyoMyo1_009403 [Myotis myotis]
MAARVRFLLLARIPTAVTPRVAWKPRSHRMLHVYRGPSSPRRKGTSLAAAGGGASSDSSRWRPRSERRRSLSPPQRNAGSRRRTPVFCFGAAGEGGPRNLKVLLTTARATEPALKPGSVLLPAPQPHRGRSWGTPCAPGRRRTSRLRFLAVLVAPAESLVVNSYLKRHNQSPSLPCQQLQRL